MSSLSRALRRWHPVHVAITGLGVVMVVILAAYVVGAYESQVTPGGLIAALSLIAISGSGLLYAWRLGAAAPVD